MNHYLNSFQAFSKNDYMPFGEKLVSEGKDERSAYVGKENDNESDLADHGVRKLDYLTGRFTSVEPLIEHKFFESPYTYSRNNPLRLLDINGFLEEDENGNTIVTYYGWGSFKHGVGDNIFQVSIEMYTAKTDKGNSVILFKTGNVNPEINKDKFSYTTNCFGFCVDSKYWITPQTMVQIILDEYDEIVRGTVKKGDMVVWYGEDGLPAHAEIVDYVDEETDEIYVLGKAGNEPFTTQKEIDNTRFPGYPEKVFRKKTKKKKTKESDGGDQNPTDKDG